MSDLHFLRPYVFFLLIPLLAFAWMLLRKNRSTKIWEKICSPDLMPYILTQKSKQHSPFYLFLFSSLLLLIVAAAGPSWLLTTQPLIKTPSGLVIALDLSKSMDAEDIKPSRAQRALYKIDDILSDRHEGQTALIVFTDESFVVTPMTDDVATIKNLLPVLGTSLMPSAGHAVHKAIKQGIELLHQAGIPQGTILLLTPELTSQDLEKSIATVADSGVTISILGVGTEENTPIPRSDGGGFMTDNKGALVITKLDKGNLNQLAAKTGGIYNTITADDSDIHSLMKNISPNYQMTQKEQMELTHSKWLDQGYLLVLLALPFVSLIFRRGILIVVLFLMPYQLQAFSWNDLWQTPDQQAQALYNQEDYEHAKDLFQNSDWQASTNYKLGNYDKAAEQFQANTSADGYFNYGTAKAKQGDLQAALAAYEKTLELQPDHEDALYNKKIIEEMMKQEQNQQNEDKNKDQKQDPNKDQQQDQKQNNDKESQQDQKQEQQNKDQQSKDQKQEKDTSESNEKPKEETQEQYRDKVDQELEKNKEEKEAQPVQQPSEEDKQRQNDDRTLQRIVDDPGALLRRKFLQQYKQKSAR